MRRRRTTFALAAAVLIAAAHAPSAAAAVPALVRQDIIDNEIENGIYTGTISLNGGYLLRVGATGGVVIRADIDGEAQLIAQAGAVSGSWTYAGTGVGLIQAPGVDAKADVNFAGQGTFSGTNTAARVLGTTMFTGIVTVSGASEPFAGSAPTDQPLENVLAGCGQIVGTYTQRINEQIEAGADAESNIRGVIALYSEAPTSEAERLAERASELLGDDEADAFQRIFAATTLLSEVQELQAELNATSSCPSTKAYFNLLTNVAADLIADALHSLEALQGEDPVQAVIIAADVISFLVEIGVSTGATGAGAVGGRGEELLVAIRERAQVAVDTNLDQAFDFDLLTQLAVLSVQQHWNLTFGEVTDRDVLKTAGVDAEGADTTQTDDAGVDE